MEWVHSFRSPIVSFSNILRSFLQKGLIHLLGGFSGNCAWYSQLPLDIHSHLILCFPLNYWDWKAKSIDQSLSQTVTAEVLDIAWLCPITRVHTRAEQQRSVVAGCGLRPHTEAQGSCPIQTVWSRPFTTSVRSLMYRRLPSSHGHRQMSYFWLQPKVFVLLLPIIHCPHCRRIICLPQECQAGSCD